MSCLSDAENWEFVVKKRRRKSQSTVAAAFNSTLTIFNDKYVTTLGILSPWIPPGFVESNLP